MENVVKTAGSRLFEWFSLQETNAYVALVYRLLVVLLLFSLSRYVFFVYHRAEFPQVDFPQLWRMMMGGLRFDLSAILYLNVIFIALTILPLPLAGKTGFERFMKWLFVVANGLGLAMNLADTAYYTFTLKRTTSSVFQAFANEDNMGALLPRFLMDYWPLVLLWVTFLGILYYSYQLVRVKPVAFTKPFIPYVIRALAVPALVYGFIGGVSGGFGGHVRPISLSNASEYINKPNQRAIVLNTPFAVLRTLSKKSRKPLKYFQDEQLSSLYSPVHFESGNVSSAKKPLNVVVIIWESFGKEYTGFFNRDKENYQGFTPFMDSLMAQSHVFTHSLANGRKSIEAMPSILAGVPSLEEPFVLSSYSGNKVNSLASLLGEEGYYTSFFHGAPNGSMGFQAFSRQAGFQDYFGMTEYNHSEDFDGFWGIWDEQFLQYFATEMGEFKEPFLSSVFTLSSHHPFQVPEKYEDILPEGEHPIQKAVAYTDLSMRKFFQTASKQPWFENTLFVITADHCNASLSEEYLTSMGHFKAPIIFHKPGDKNFKGVHDVLAQQTDILPTVLSELGIKKDFVAFGRDVFDTTSTPFAVNHLSGYYQYYEGNYHLQFDVEGDSTVALYDFVNDPLEENDLLNELPEKQKELEDKAKAYIQQYNNRMVGNQLVVEESSREHVYLDIK